MIRSRWDQYCSSYTSRNALFHQICRCENVLPALNRKSYQLKSLQPGKPPGGWPCSWGGSPNIAFKTRQIQGKLLFPNSSKFLFLESDLCFSRHHYSLETFHELRNIHGSKIGWQVQHEKLEISNSEGRQKIQKHCLNKLFLSIRDTYEPPGLRAATSRLIKFRHCFKYLNSLARSRGSRLTLRPPGLPCSDWAHRCRSQSVYLTAPGSVWPLLCHVCSLVTCERCENRQEGHGAHLF